MSERGFHVIEEALRGYAQRVPGLADDASSISTSRLAGVTELPGDCFCDVGREVGLPEAFRQAAQRQLDGIAAVAAAMRGLGGAVGGALRSYQQQDEDHAAMINRAGQV